ncbi:MAG: adenylate/guanylate cyclase domain-containing protein, partial [Gammaproteobacteria bacterium]
MIEKLKESWVRLVLGTLVLAVFLCHATNVWRLRFVDQMENLAYDTHLKLTMPGTRDDSVVIVDIDEISLRAEGRWPWPRDKLARLVEALFEDYDIRLLGFDIVFAEPDESSGLRVLEGLAEGELKDDAGFLRRLAEVRPSLDYDTIFSETIGRYPVVLGYYFNIDQGGAVDTPRSGALPPPILVKSVFQGKKVQFLEASGYGGNLPRLTEQAIGAGHFSQQPDQDGVVRRVPMLVRFEENYYPSLSLEIVRHALGGADVLPRFEKPLFDTRGYPGLEWLTVGDAAIPVDRNVKTLVPFRGRQGSFPYVPATQVLHGTADKSVLAGKIVLVGTSAPGLLDLRATPMEEAYPGVEVHANLVAGILGGEVLQFPEYTLGAEVILLLVTGISMIIAGAVLSPLITTVVTVGGIGAYIGLNHVVWSNGIVLPVASGILMVLTLFLLHMSYGYFVETRGKRQLTGLFGQYVPPELVDEMARAPSAYSLDAENRELSVLFSDVRGFTTISEGLPPKDLAELMNQFLTPMTEVIHTRRGTIDKYMGDAIMAFWGAPLSDPNHARHAIEAGMQMIARLDEVNVEFARR